MIQRKILPTENNINKQWIFARDAETVKALENSLEAHSLFKNENTFQKFCNENENDLKQIQNKLADFYKICRLEANVLIQQNVITPSDIITIYNDVLTISQVAHVYNLQAIKRTLSELESLANKSDVKKLMQLKVMRPSDLFELYRRQHGKPNHFLMHKSKNRFDDDKTRIFLDKLSKFCQTKEVSELIKSKTIVAADLFKWAESSHLVLNALPGKQSRIDGLYLAKVLKPSDIFTMLEKFGAANFEARMKDLIILCESQEALNLVSTGKINPRDIFKMFIERNLTVDLLKDIDRIMTRRSLER